MFRQTRNATATRRTRTIPPSTLPTMAVVGLPVLSSLPVPLPGTRLLLADAPGPGAVVEVAVMDSAASIFSAPSSRGSPAPGTFPSAAGVAAPPPALLLVEAGSLVPLVPLLLLPTPLLFTVVVGALGIFVEKEVLAVVVVVADLDLLKDVAVEVAVAIVVVAMVVAVVAVVAKVEAMRTQAKFLT